MTDTVTSSSSEALVPRVELLSDSIALRQPIYGTNASEEEELSHCQFFFSIKLRTFEKDQKRIEKIKEWNRYRSHSES